MNVMKIMKVIDLLSINCQILSANLIGQNSVNISDIFLFSPCKYKWNVKLKNFGTI